VGTIHGIIWLVVAIPATNLRPAPYLLSGLKKGTLYTQRKGLVELKLG
jgi:hypothetical protein